MTKNKIILLMVILLLSGCTSKDANKKTINIAVTGSPNTYSECFEKGIKRAYEDVCAEYKDSGFEIKCEFYDDKGNYESAEKITAKIINDSNITAVIASSSPEICENQAYQTDKAGKILICPHWTYDSMFEDSFYDKVFSLNYSNKDIGNIMENIALNSSAKKWAICYSDDEISTTEIKDFKKKSDIKVYDFVRINTLEADFENVVNRWKLLGIDGVILIPYKNEGFRLLYRLKESIPKLCVISDSSIDDNNELENNRKYFENVYMVDSFYVSDDTTEIFPNDEYSDTWEIHGYNAFRMIVDTAVLNDTCDTERIASVLHEKGYIGELESYKFYKNGILKPKIYSYVRFTKDDYEEIAEEAEDKGD